MTYVIKILAYQDENGHPTSDITRAQKFETEELAHLAADVADGICVECKECKTFKQSRPRKKKSEKPKKKKMANQSWMRGVEK